MATQASVDGTVSVGACCARAKTPKLQSPAEDADESLPLNSVARTPDACVQARSSSPSGCALDLPYTTTDLHKAILDFRDISANHPQGEGVDSGVIRLLGSLCVLWALGSQSASALRRQSHDGS